MSALEIPLTLGLVALVDDQDFDRVSAVKWCAHRERLNVYALRRSRGKIIRMHRFILEAPDGLDVDHINGNGLDNRRSNLRIVDRQHNLFNQNKKSRGCSSRYRGVCWDRSKGNWMAYINDSGVRTYLGRFETELEAAIAYDDAGRARDPEHFTPNISTKVTEE